MLDANCRYDETATEQSGHGALTQGLLDSVTQSNPGVTYLQLIDQLRDDVQDKLGLTQTPTLLGQETVRTTLSWHLWTYPPDMPGSAAIW